ncbi:Abi family protein [Microbacterium sp. NPDC056052]|uniref:Abi family protein n=1 Tax=Microbacterium sp. NPDC056052 TaxID=3345695 RepID=UPI0035E300CC
MKDHKSTADLVALLADKRGLVIEDRTRAADTLRRINYYRFTGYSRHFQERPAAGKNDYLSGASFDQIVHLIERDDELRLRLMIPLSTVEQAVRTRFAHVAGREFGCQAFYLDPTKHLSDSPDALNRIRRVKEDLQNSQHPTIAHYRHGSDVAEVPIWVAVEVLSFGKIAWLIESLDSPTMREELADFFSFSRNTFPRTLQSLSALRNVCAHHGQVWNRMLTAQCPLPLNKRERPRDVVYHPQGIYPAIMALSKLAQGAPGQSHLSAVDRILRRNDGYARGVLTPAGVR